MKTLYFLQIDVTPKQNATGRGISVQSLDVMGEDEYQWHVQGGESVHKLRLGKIFRPGKQWTSQTRMVWTDNPDAFEELINSALLDIRDEAQAIATDAALTAGNATYMMSATAHTVVDLEINPDIPDKGDEK